MNKESNQTEQEIARASSYYGENMSKAWKDYAIKDFEAGMREVLLNPSRYGLSIEQGEKEIAEKAIDHMSDITVTDQRGNRVPIEYLQSWKSRKSTYLTNLPSRSIEQQVLSEEDKKNVRLISAYGLETRVWGYSKRSGYGCAECCNGDRCDEDCKAKYKGNRKGCPHCKGAGWIKEEDATPITNRISEQEIKELWKQHCRRSAANGEYMYEYDFEQALAALTAHPKQQAVECPDCGGKGYTGSHRTGDLKQCKTCSTRGWIGQHTEK